MAKRNKKQAGKQVKFTRQQALDSRPVTAPIIERKPLKDGGEHMVIEVPTSPWRQRFLRMPSTLKRPFEFDDFGVQVIDMCDGQKPVKYIVERFVRDYELDPHEAERAVTTFLRTLIRKGIVSLYLPKGKG